MLVKNFQLIHYSVKFFFDYFNPKGALGTIDLMS